MIKITPHYFDKFVCIASECVDNCCFGGWQIDIDDDTLDYYRKVEGDFGKRLRDAIDEEEHCFRLKNGVCPFLDVNNLCGIYGELGPEHMGVVCTQFPRFTEYYGQAKETGIGLACEEACRIILDDSEKFTLIEQETDEEVYEDAEFDGRLYDALRAVRLQFFDIVQNETFDLKQILAILLYNCHEIQHLVNANDYYALSAYEIKRDVPGEHAENEDYLETMNAIWCAYSQLDPLDDKWERTVDAAFSQLEKKNEYIKKVKNFELNYPDSERDYRKILNYYLFRYFLKASYDHDVYGKAQFAATALMAQRDMELLGMFADRREVIHVFSRQVEYLEDSLDILSEEFLFDECFKWEKLRNIFA